VTDDPFLALPVAASPLTGANATEAAPFLHGIFGLLENIANFGGGIPVFDRLLLDPKA
jgi:hypothetical protein